MVQSLKFLALFLLFCAPHLASAQIFNFSGFETSDNQEAHSSAGTFSVQSSSVKNGGYALKTNPVTTATASYKLGAEGSTGASSAAVACQGICGMGFWFRPNILPATLEEPIFKTNDEGTDDDLRLTIQSDGKLGLYDSNGTTFEAALGTTTTALSVGTWYYIEIRASGTTSLAYGVRINGGSEEITGTRGFGDGGRPFLTFELGKVANFNGNTVDYDYDDFYVRDGGYLPSAQNAKILRMVANEAGETYTGWDKGTNGGTFAETDEFPTDGATTFASSTDSGEDFVAYDMQDVEVLGAGGGGVNILSTKGFSRVFERAAGTSVLSAILLRSASTNSTTTAADPGTTAVSRFKIFRTDPATSAAWTPLGINALELGANTEGTNAMDIRLSTLGLMIYFVPQPTPTLTNFTYCREMTMTAGGASGGVATTTTAGFALHASTTLSTLAGTSSGGRIQNVALASPTAFEHPIDLIVTTDDNCGFSTGTLLDFYSEKYSSTTGAIDLWLEGTDVSSTTAKQVNMYYGYATTTEFQNRAGTFGALGEALVYNMNKNPAQDRTGGQDVTYFNRNASSSGMVKADLVEGYIGDGLTFNDSTESLAGRNFSDFDATSKVSVCAWSKPSGDTSDDVITEAQSVSPTAGFTLFRDNTGAVSGRTDTYTVFLEDNATNAFTTIEGSTNSGPANVWRHVCFMYEEGLAVGLHLMINGLEDANSPTSTALMTSTDSGTTNFQVASTPLYGGVIDDIRIYLSFLDPMDILTIYNNTKSSAVFWTFGAEQTQAVAETTAIERAIIRTGEWIIKTGEWLFR